MNGKKLAELRESAGLTQLALAIRSGVNPTTISEMERGVARSSNPTLSTLEALAKALGTTAAELLAEPETKEAATA